MLNYILFSCKKRKYLRYSNDLKNVIPHWSFVRWYTAMHDRANILISPSSLGRLVVLAYLHWRVANATNLNRVGNIGLHRGWFAVSFLCNWKIKQKFSVVVLYCFFSLFILSIYRCFSVIHLVFGHSLSSFAYYLFSFIARCYLSFLYLLRVTVHCDLFFFCCLSFLTIINHCLILHFIIYFYV